MNIEKIVSHFVPNVKDYTKEELQYIDVERMNETITTYRFKHMTEIEYATIAAILKQQYNLPIKYLEPDYDNCSYIAQKSLLPTNESKITDAYISIEPLNQNIFKQISFTPINQKIELGTIITLHESIPFNANARKLLTSASLKCDIALCNRCIPYSSLDIGSEITGKFVVKTSTMRGSMSLYRFRRPSDNVIEFVTPDYLNVDCNQLLEMTKIEIEKRINNENKKKILETIDMMLSLK